MPYFEDALIHREFELDKLPDQIEIETARGCNLQCKMCPLADPNNAVDRPILMNRETFEIILSQISDKPRSLLLCLIGEPLLNPHIVEFVASSKLKGHEVSLITNGSLMNPELAEKLIRSNLDRAVFSIDGYSKATYEEIRVNANFETVMENLRNFIKINRKSGGKTRVEINYVVSDKNIKEANPFFAEWGPLVEKINFIPVNDWGGKITLPKEFKCEAENVDQSRLDRMPCLYLWTVLHISAEGNIMLCVNDFKQIISLPNVKEKRLLEIFKEDLGKHRKAHASNDCDYEPCKSCRVWFVKFERPAIKPKRSSLANEIFDWIDPKPFGHIDHPSYGETITGPLDVKGWALAKNGRRVIAVEILLNGRLVKKADYGSFRPDIWYAYPDCADTGFSVFHGQLNSKMFPNGDHILSVEIIDDRGTKKNMGSRPVQIIN